MSQDLRNTSEYLKMQIENLETQIQKHKSNETKLYGKLEERWSQVSSKLSKKGEQTEEIPNSYNYTRLSQSRRSSSKSRIFGSNQRAQSCISGYRGPYEGALTSKKINVIAAKKLAQLENTVARSRAGVYDNMS